MKKIYLDYAASTPVDKEVEEAMQPYFGLKFGNPGALHSFGQETMAAIDHSREIIAKSLGADFSEIIFTGSATEANNLALRGIVRGSRVQPLATSAKKSTLNPKPYTLNPRIIVSAIEHESVLETAKDLENEGVEVIYLPVNQYGVVDLKSLKNALNDRTVLVSIMYANNEIGTIQPITEISRIIKDFKQNTKYKIQNTRYPLLHTDAVQAFQYLDCNVNKLGVDLLTLSGHKIYGPKGIGALYVRGSSDQALGSRKNGLAPSAYSLAPIITGGGQEFGLRSGTQSVPLIAGFGKAVELISNLRKSESKRVLELRNYFWQGLKEIYPKAEVNGIKNQELGIRNDKTIIHNSLFILPNILNIYFPGYLSKDLLIKLDMAGVAVSAGPACSMRSSKPSVTLQALGLSQERLESSLRFSLGKFTIKEEIDEVLRRIKIILE